MAVKQLATILALLTTLVNSQIERDTKIEGRDFSEDAKNLIADQCFQEAGYYAGDVTKGVLVDPFKELNDENLFKPDMKIYELYVCIDPEDGHIVGIEITLRTVASQVVGEHTLNIVGTSQGANCKPYVIPDDAYLKFLEVEYSFSKIWTLMIKVSNDYYSFWGD